MKRLRVLAILIVFVLSSTFSFATCLPDVRDVAKKVLPAVVNISTTQVVKYQNPFGGFNFNQNSPFNFFFKRFFNNFGPPEIKRKVHALGSGFIISKDGYILTNYHVIKMATDIRVTLLNSGDVYKAKVVGTDPKADIALIKINPRGPLPTLKLGDSSKIHVGDWVVAVGNPFGLNGTVTVGIISAKGRVLPGEGPFDHFLQTDAAINPGNSGGPLVNMEGEVIGINTAIIANGQGIGFAIPINMVKAELPYLMKGEKVKRGYLGVMIQPLTPEAARSLGLRNARGAIISQVFKNTAAAKAGLKPGDIIVSVDGKPLRSSYDLPYIISSFRPGTKVKIGIIRNGKKMTIEVKLGQRPENFSVNSGGEVYKTDFGFSVSNITPQLAKKFGIKVKSGVVIVRVQPDSFAYMVGLKPGDVVVKLNYKPVKDLKDFENIIKKAKDVIFLDIIRGNAHIFITIQR